MRFVDEARIRVVAGDGGNGVVAFRREKFVPFGGPSGGDGGRGGDVILVGDEGLSTLLDLTHARTISAARGEHGQGKDCHGRGGADREERIPVGTQIFDAETDELLFDVTVHGQRVVVVRGGKGGRGNIHFATPHDRAPRRAEKGDPGQARELRLELKVLADVGLLGFPNAGKSTFVRAVSAARPKVADYPFTTLVPSLGVVEVGGGPRAGGAYFVVADIPGLVPGASTGVGLGIRFLKHVERTRALLHLVTIDPGEGRDPLADYHALRRELELFRPELARRPEIVALSKADLPEVRDAHPALAEKFAAAGVELHLVSAASRIGVDRLVGALWKMVLEGRRAEREGQQPPDRPLADAPPGPGDAGAAAKASAGKRTARKPAPEAKATAKKKPAPKAKAKAKAIPKKKPAPKAKAKAKAIPKKKPAPKAKAKAKAIPKKKPAPKAKAKAIPKKKRGATRSSKTKRS